MTRVHTVPRLFASALSITLAGCAIDSGQPADRRARSNQQSPALDRDLLVYDAWTDQNVQRVCAGERLRASGTRSALLDSLCGRLSAGYFAGYGGRPVALSFRVRDIATIPAPEPLYIGLIDIRDSARVAMRTFFQGSAGARMTQAVLCATFLQPGEDPLLDGVVFVYNGEMMPALDHIDMSGVQTPDMAQRQMRRLGLCPDMSPGRTSEEGLRR
jgi:hypothetical protein